MFIVYSRNGRLIQVFQVGSGEVLQVGHWVDHILMPAIEGMLMLQLSTYTPRLSLAICQDCLDVGCGLWECHRVKLAEGGAVGA